MSLRDLRKGGGYPLLNTEATSAPRSGFIGVLPVDNLAPTESELASGDDPHEEFLEIAVHCPDCSNYARIVGFGSEFRNITKLVDPRFSCSTCSWHPQEHTSPQKWQAYYAGRLGGTMLFAMNERHMDVLVNYLETPPNRRGTVEYPWEYRALMGRLPRGILSGRFRNDMVSLIKRLQKTRPRGV